MSRSSTDTGAVGGSPGLRLRLRTVAGRGAPRCLFLDEQGAWAPGDGLRADERVPGNDWPQDAAGSGGVTLVVSDRLTHSLLIADDVPVDSEDALAHYARAQWLHYHGPEAGSWPVVAWRDRARGACALHGIDLDALRRSAGASGLQLASIRPAWSAALATALVRRPELATQDHAVVAWVEAAHVTLMRLARGRLVGLDQRFLDAPTGTCLRAAILDALAPGDQPLARRPVVLGWGARELDPLVFDALLSPETPALSAACLGTARCPGPDFAAPSPWRRRVAVAALAGGTLALAMAAGDLLAQSERLRALEPATAPPAHADARPRSAGTPQSAQDASMAAERAAGRLAFPWPDAFASIESATPPNLAWTSLRLAADDCRAHLSGIADDAHAVLALSRALQASGWRDVALANLRASTPGATAVEFDVQATVPPGLGPGRAGTPPASPTTVSRR